MDNEWINYCNSTSTSIVHTFTLHSIVVVLITNMCQSCKQPVIINLMSLTMCLRGHHQVIVIGGSRSRDQFNRCMSNKQWVSGDNKVQRRRHRTHTRKKRDTKRKKHENWWCLMRRFDGICCTCIMHAHCDPLDIRIICHIIINKVVHSTDVATYVPPYNINITQWTWTVCIRDNFQ